MMLHRAMGPALAVLVLTASAQAQENDLPKFAGAWTVTAAELGGQKDDGSLGLKGASFEFGSKVARFTQTNEEGEPITDEHPFKIDPRSNRIVLYQQPDPNDPMADPKVGMQRGIYQFSGTSLFLCLTRPDAPEFPTEFKSGSGEEGEEQFLMLKLDRAATAGAAAGARQ